jgi:RNA polymerase sigma factor (TIGR02999 family)
MSDVTRLLDAVDRGEPQAAEELLPLVYEELRRLAHQKMANEKPGQTLQATALVHEVYLRLIGTESQRWDHRGHFFAAAAEAMRRILVERARHKRSQRAGGSLRRVESHEADVIIGQPDEEVLAVDEALERLGLEDARTAELVKLHFFVGLTLQEAGAVLGISHRTAERQWAWARAWLYREMKHQG